LHSRIWIACTLPPIWVGEDGFRFAILRTWAFFALLTKVAKSKIKDWVTQSHYQNWRTISGCKQFKRWLIQSSRKTALYFLVLSRIWLRMVLSLITGHCRLNGHLSKMRLQSDPICVGCLLEEETANHFICTCPNLAQKRQKVFGKPILDKAKISKLSASDILKFTMYSHIATKRVCTIGPTEARVQELILHPPKSFNQNF
jgi:hypothetical protein